MTKNEFENYTGNLRIKYISFDTLTQMWEGNLEEYDPKVEEPLAKFYVGKVGKYESCSYIFNDYLRCACINVIFSNGYTVMVDVDDVVAVDEEQTWEEFLPKIPLPGSTPVVYNKLSDAEKEFSDKMFLQLIAGHVELDDRDMRVMLDRTIQMAQYRSDMHRRGWDTTWLNDLDD